MLALRTLWAIHFQIVLIVVLVNVDLCIVLQISHPDFKPLFLWELHDVLMSSF
jgi:hypothetical protein